MSWKAHFNKNTITAQQAVKKIKHNDKVVIAHAVGEPSHIIDAMVTDAQAYQNVELIHMVAMGKCEYCLPQYRENFRHNAIFAGAGSKSAIAQGRADFTPCFFYQVPQLFHSTLKPDVAMVMVTPPDENGFCSLGVSVDYTLEAVKTAKLVIAQVNAYMPRTAGESFVFAEDIDCFVLHDAPLIALQPPQIGSIEETIGSYCASLIKDGDTLQLGIGAIPDAVLSFLKEKRDLGIHSEMFSDGVVALAEAGVITNKKKTIHTGKYVATFLMGTQKLYSFVNNNPDVLILPVDYVNHPGIAAKNDNLVSINSCVQVDLMGQVCSEAIGSLQISGVGGQVDFVRAAAMSRGGRSIIAMPSSTKGISKIVAKLDDGAPVTTSRCDVDYIITEYGIAHLKGKTLRERAQALIGIAHPDFREELTQEFKRRFGIV